MDINLAALQEAAEALAYAARVGETSPGDARFALQRAQFNADDAFSENLPAWMSFTALLCDIERALETPGAPVPGDPTGRT